MSADDTSGMKATLDGLVREQAERRALRAQRAEEIKARSQEFMTKQVQTAQRYVEHRRELGQRKTKSGWSTDRSHAEPGGGSAFGETPRFDDAPFAPEPSPARTGRDVPRRAPRPRPMPADDEDDAFLNNRWRE
ncbi:hypothetical protein [Amycolatopsis regifaucium]|uniref:Uncharacterized protein n=1 Tax=Amycolatopsis regifaucium TaxID=546365 RepID=A0A154M8Y3_9PSEU|nr:hypothetical protein [Amycolatopsis regifaucium]KZB81006.1 hypothetical protein AVL48_37710 [Amycolatopsis regifaucium]OKA11365.1 hypothetical protein ATP06_0200420 [Amycolatopsis regifaucium]SFH43685.1 hypothetical protein SAMN04489731_104180 [Amycolatopsis regifaucium]